MGTETAKQATEFLRGLFSEVEEGWITICSIEENKSVRTTWLRTDEIDQAEKHCAQQEKNRGSGLYFGVGVRRHKTSGRGEAADVSGIPGVWLDIDFAESAGRKKSKKRYPPQELAEQTLERLPLLPSVIVNSGGGLHAYWLFHELLTDTTLAAKLVAGWQSLTSEHLRRLGDYQLDSVHDLARVLRLPGSWNYAHAKRVELLAAYSDPEKWHRYEPSDVEEFCIEVADPTERSRAVVGDLVLLYEANPPVEKLDALRENSPEFRRVWDHKRDFPSNSERELSLASTAVAALWNDQEIADLLISHRRKWEPDKIKKLTERKDYIVRTIAAARGDIHRDVAIRSLNGEPGAEPKLTDDHESRAKQAEKRVEQVPSQVDERERILKHLSAVFGVSVARWLQFGKEKPIFSLVLENGMQIRIGNVNAVITNDTALRAAIYAETGAVMKHVARKAWQGVCESLAKIRELDEAQDATDAAAAKAALEAYLERKNFYGAGQRDMACIEGAAFIEGDLLYVAIDSVLKWVNGHTPRRWERGEILHAMKGLGFESVSVNYQASEDSRKCRRYWRCQKRVLGPWE